MPHRTHINFLTWRLTKTLQKPFLQNFHVVIKIHLPLPLEYVVMISLIKRETTLLHHSSCSSRASLCCDVTMARHIEQPLSRVYDFLSDSTLCQIRICQCCCQNYFFSSLFIFFIIFLPVLSFLGCVEKSVCVFICVHVGKRQLACEGQTFLFPLRGGTSATQRQKFHSDEANQCVINPVVMGFQMQICSILRFSWSILVKCCVHLRTSFSKTQMLLLEKDIFNKY